jgi:hypothetical protein
MENLGIIKQAKSDIFKAMHPIITFYINKGAKPVSLRKYYKNSKRFSDLLSDINNKGVNLVKDEKEYEKLVREILNEILDDFIANDKDKEYKNKQENKMKHIKEFNSYNESLLAEVGKFLVCAYLVYEFLLWVAKKQINKSKNDRDRKSITSLLTGLKNMNNVPISDFSDRFVMNVNNADGGTTNIRVLKNEKEILIFSKNYQNEIRIKLEDDEYSNLLKIIKK